jgi:hypothetical protein
LFIQIAGLCILRFMTEYIYPFSILRSFQATHCFAWKLLLQPSTAGSEMDELMYQLMMSYRRVPLVGL